MKQMEYEPNIIFYVSLGLLVAALLFQVRRKFFFSEDDARGDRQSLLVSRLLFVVALLFVVGWYCYLVYAQYIAWQKAGPPMSFLVPPHQSITYVLWYHYIRFGLYYSFSAAAALILLFGALYYDKTFGGRFFEPGEPYLAALSVLLLGNHAWGYLWIYYLAGVFLVGLVGSFVLNQVLKRNERFSLFFLWLPLAIAGILMTYFL